MNSFALTIWSILTFKCKFLHLTAPIIHLQCYDTLCVLPSCGATGAAAIKVLGLYLVPKLPRVGEQYTDS